MAPAAALRQEGERLAADFPALIAEGERVAASVSLGVHGRRRPGVGETFWEFRHHRPYDPRARIDWRRSGRSDHLYVREKEFESAQTVLVWRDGRAGMVVRPDRARATKKDRASVLLIALASLLTRGGERVAVLGESEAARTGRVGFARVSERLVTGPGGVESFAPARAGRSARVVAASDFYEGEEVWRERLTPFAAAGAAGALVQVIDPEEETFPFQGRVAFQDPGLSGSGAARIFGRAQSVRAVYRDVYAAHRAAMETLARRLGWTLVVSRTDQPASVALLSLYTAMAPERRR